MPAGIAQALAAVEARIASACSLSGRPRSAVQLVAVSKTVGADRIDELIAAGQRVFGENRVQEALDKMDKMDKMDGREAVGGEARWHFIGHLQRNKARQVVGRFELLHTVDSLRLAAEVNRRAADAGVVQAVLLQVRLGGEATKSGVDPGGLASLLDGVAAFDHLDVRGLMTIPPPAERPEDNRHWFAALRELRDGLAHQSRPLAELSMGMTDDFEVAIEEGATLVRVGRAIFGERTGSG